MKDKILQLLVDVCEDETILEDETINLIETNILDSLAFINLISRLEEEFNIEIEPTEVPYEVWTSTKSIVEFVQNLIFTKEEGEVTE